MGVKNHLRFHNTDKIKALKFLRVSLICFFQSLICCRDAKTEQTFLLMKSNLVSHCIHLGHWKTGKRENRMLHNMLSWADSGSTAAQNKRSERHFRIRELKSFTGSALALLLWDNYVKPEDISFTLTGDEEKQQIFTPEKSKPVNFWHFFLQNDLKRWIR